MGIKSRPGNILPVIMVIGSLIYSCGGENSPNGIKSRQKGEDCDSSNLCLDGLYCERGKCRVICNNKEECSPQESCVNHRCVANNIDTCLDGFGGRDGKDCTNCLADHYGDSCLPCECQHGKCWDGKSGNGLCKGDCDPGWEGTNCDRCSGELSGKNCDITKSCQYGTPNLGVNGDGHCSQCDANWSGPDCNISKQCVNGETNLGVNGDGHCKPNSCQNGWTGENCNACPTGFYGENCFDCTKDSPLFGQKECTFTDERNDLSKKQYRIVTIGSQLWMAENLAYSSDNVFCYAMNDTNNTNSNIPAIPDYVDKYGCLYILADIVQNTVCPAGWRLPTDADIEELLSVTNAENDVSVLCSSVWDSTYSNASGFSALPGGVGFVNSESFLNTNGFQYVTISRAIFWLFSDKNQEAGAFNIMPYMPADGQIAFGVDKIPDLSKFNPLTNGNLASIRCIKENN